MCEPGWVLLGNPGPEYELTRHNLGRRLGVRLVGDLGLSWTLHTEGPMAQGLVPLGGAPVRLRALQPRTFMNESGRAAAGWARYFGIPPDRLVVFVDDCELDPGAWRLEFGGPARGHNGLRSLIQSLKTSDFWRLRLGIGRPTGRQPLADWVLRPLPEAEWAAWEASLSRISEDLAAPCQSPPPQKSQRSSR